MPRTLSVLYLAFGFREVGDGEDSSIALGGTGADGVHVGIEQIGAVIGDCIHCSRIFWALGPAATFSDNQLKRAPARAARLGRLSSPRKPCEMDLCAAIISACWRAALARASSHFNDGSPWAARSPFMAWKSCCSAASALGWARADVHENTPPTMNDAIITVCIKVVSFM